VLTKEEKMETLTVMMDLFDKVWHSNIRAPGTPSKTLREVRIANNVILKQKDEKDHNYQPEHYENLAFEKTTWETDKSFLEKYGQICFLTCHSPISLNNIFLPGRSDF
jgi:hypothetical protein